MTFREKLAKEHPDRVSDLFYGGAMGCPHQYGYENYESCGDRLCPECWSREIPGTEPINVKEIMEGEEPVEDLIHHPNHYTFRERECIDEMVLVFGLDATLTFCKLNAWKYRYRTSEKGGEQDMQKSDRYIGMIKELTDKYGDTN